jgi:hypothetical protein
LKPLEESRGFREESSSYLSCHLEQTSMESLA